MKSEKLKVKNVAFSSLSV